MNEGGTVEDCRYENAVSDGKVKAMKLLLKKDAAGIWKIVYEKDCNLRTSL
jgi:hypothetical protein